jgi:hypothetical protein
MRVTCSHTDSIELIELPDDTRSWCHVDNVAFVVSGR